MLGKAKIKVSEASKFAVACELSDVTIRDNRVIGDEAVVELLFKSADNLISVGGYMKTLPADVKPTPPKAKKEVAGEVADEAAATTTKLKKA